MPGGGRNKLLRRPPADAKVMASRDSSGKVLNALAKNIPWLIGGPADPAHSNKTNLTFDAAGHFFAREYRRRNLHFCVRQHAIGAIVNRLHLSPPPPPPATLLQF